MLNRVIAVMALASGIGSLIIIAMLVLFPDSDTAAARHALAPTWINAQTMLIYAGAASASIAMIGKSIAFLRHEWLLSRMVYARQGMLPAATGGIVLDASHIVDGAQIMSATVGGKGNVEKLPGTGMKEALRLPESIAPDPVQISIAPQQVLDGYDPEREPHWLLLGQTGSGKSRALMLIAQHIARRYTSEFLVCERDGIDWNVQADARTVEGYATVLDTVEQERQYRAGLLRANDVDHVLRLNEPLPLLVVIIEEAENIQKRLAGIDRARAKKFEDTLQDLAGLGRKQGIVLIVTTTTGTSSVFNGPTRRNLGNHLIFRSELIAGDQWGIPREMSLSTLPSGTAYAPKYGCTVTFPLIDRPMLPKSRLYHEPEDNELLLTSVNVDNAIARLDDDPTTVPIEDHIIEDGRKPTPEEAEAMRKFYARMRKPSKTAVCFKFYNYKDGSLKTGVYGYVTDALEGRI